MVEWVLRILNGFLWEIVYLFSFSMKILLEDINILLISWLEFIVVVISIYMYKLIGENDIVLGLLMMGCLGFVFIYILSMVMNLVLFCIIVILNIIFVELL